MDTKQFLKAYIIKDVTHNTADAWQSILENTLKSAWNKLRPFELQPESTEPKDLDTTSELLVICQSLPAFNSLNEDDVKNWCEIDLADVGYEMFSDNEIVTHTYPQNIQKLMMNKINMQSLIRRPFNHLTTAIKLSLIHI